MRISFFPITSFKEDNIPVLKAVLDMIENWNAGHVGEDNLENDAVTTAKIDDDAVTAAKLALFVSAEQTGTGAAQNVAHGLGITPTAVLIAITDTNNLSTVSVVEGTHTSTNVVVTVSNTAKFKVWAMP